MEADLPPGVYSVLVLSEDGTWEQPTFRTDKQMSEHDFRMQAEHECRGFISFSVCADDECPSENVRSFSD